VDQFPVPLVMLGAGLLWFGWFGFNAGSALGANGQASMVFVNTQVAGCTAMLGWLVAEKIQHGTFTSLGAASGGRPPPARSVTARSG
jgi:Amt family ammonium transporter